MTEEITWPLKAAEQRAKDFNCHDPGYTMPDHFKLGEQWWTP